MKMEQVVVVAAAVAGSLFASGSAAAAVVSTGTLNTLGKCMDVPGWAVSNGTGVQIWDCNSGSNQVWQFWSDGTLRPAFDPDKCLDLPDWQTTNGTNVQIWDCNGGTNQKWTLDADQTLRGYGGKCLDVPNGQTGGGTGFVYWDCNGGSNQHFTVGEPYAPAITFLWGPHFEQPVGGDVSLNIFSDGAYDFFGSYTDYGFFDYDVQLVCLAKDRHNRGYPFYFSGTVHGTISLWLGGSRTVSFSMPSSSNTLRNVYWSLVAEDQINGDAIQCSSAVNGDSGSLLKQLSATAGIVGLLL